jgi:hypothetical protein
MLLATIGRLGHPGPGMSLARTLGWINFRHGRRALVWAGLLAALAVTLDFLPLVDVLGFDFCFVVGLVAALAGVDIGHGTVDAARRNRPAVRPVGLVFQAMVASLAVIVPPLLLSLANAVRVRNCNLGAGLVFFLLLPAATAVYAAGTGAAVAIAVPGRRLGRMLAFALPLFSIAWALLRLYRDPAVFAFDPYAGYFPGPIYDEALRPPLRLLWFRLANLTWLAAVVATLDCLCHDPARPLRLSLRSLRAGALRWHRPLLAALLIVASVAWFENRGRLGFHVTHATLAEILSRQTRSEHFLLRSDPAAESDRDIALAQQDLEFRYYQLARILGTEPALPITVYRFPSAAAKKEAVGAANTLFAKPWSREIFVQADVFPARRLRHEMAHVFAAGFGDPIFGVSLAWHFWGPIPIPRLATGLIEGLAEAADFDNPSGRFTTHEEAAALIALGRAPDLGRVLGAGFSLESGARAYTIAGSFCRFLLDRFGAATLREIYRSAGDFQRVYGTTVSALANEWRAFLAALPVDRDCRAEVEERFRQPAIFHKVCARELAARVADARARLGTSPADAVALLSSACSDDPEEPTYRLNLAEALLAAGEATRSLAVLSALGTDETLTRSLRYRAANLEAGIHFRAGRLPDSEVAIRRALANATDDGEERFAKAEMRALADAQAQGSLGRVTFGDERGQPTDPGLTVFLVTDFAHEHPGEALGPYLVGRQLAARDPRLAASYFASACPLADGAFAIPLDAVFLKECRRQWGESAYLAGDLPAARAATTWVFEHADREADRLRAKDFLARIAWKSSR